MKKIYITCALVIFLITGCTQNATQNQPTASQTSTVQQETDAKKSDSAEIELNDGSKVKVIINKVTFTEERNDQDQTDPNQVIKLDYGYENISSQEDIEINNKMFRVYDQNNALATQYILDTGKNCGFIRKGTVLQSAELFYSLSNESKYVTIVFRYSGATSGDADATFKILVQDPE